MPGNTLLLICLAALFAFALAAFQYYYNSRNVYRYPALFTLLRFITLFSFLILLINPKLEKTEYISEKTDLLLVVDNSRSIEKVGSREDIQEFVRELSEDPAVRERFDLQTFSFGEDLEQSSNFEFSERQTNINNALKYLEQLYKNSVAPTIIVSDGNQTFGEDYTFTADRYSNTIFPVVVGDTAAYNDLSINRINVNRYAYRDNRFPVEIFVNYTGEEAVESTIQITSSSSVLHSGEVVFDATSNSQVVQIHLPATGTGVVTYQAEILPLPAEKDTLNNRRNFAVEIIDERTSVLLVTAIIHPDLGALKKSIESNQQRDLEIHQLGSSTVEPGDYDLVIFYQPNPEFRNLLEQVQQDNVSYWMITGPETDWHYLNGAQDLFSREITGQTEDYFPVVNENFNAFQLNELDFSEFPPLKGSFGELNLNSSAEPLLFQQIQRIETDNPLLAIVDDNNSRKAFLFGAGVWKWRTASYLESDSFQEFDDFLGKLVQFLSSGHRRERLSVDYESFYYGNERMVISAQYFDRNYDFDSRGELVLEITDEKDQETREIPFLLKDNRYEVDISHLPASEYTFEVSVVGENLSKEGKFTVVEFDIEQQFSNANVEGLQSMLTEENEQLYFLKDSKRIVNKLLSDKNYTPVQRRQEKTVPLIDWFYLLGIITLSLTTEWFLRKYYGLI